MKRLLISIAGLMCTLCVVAQSSMPAPGGRFPGSGGNSMPAPGGSSWTGGWGAPWGSPPPPPSWSPGSFGSPDWQNSGMMTVMACGYDAQGVWRVIPLRVSYKYNGIQYNVNVLNAWDPWTDMWDDAVNVPAVNTSYYIRGNNYDFYVVLSTGTYYFNL